MFYKILKKDLIHHGFQYQKGLNVDTVPFKPSGSCQAGGLYFTDLENIGAFLTYGELIAEVTIPADADVYHDPSGEKQKANKIILSNIIPLEEWDMWKDEEFALFTVQQHGALTIQNIKNPSEAVQLTAVNNNAWVIQYINNPSEAVQLAAVNNDEWAINYIENPSEAVQLAAVNKDASSIEFIKNPSEAAQLAAVRSNPYVIMYVGNPSELVQLEAVRSKPCVIRHIKNPTEAVQLAATGFRRSKRKRTDIQRLGFEKKIRNDS